MSEEEAREEMRYLAKMFRDRGCSQSNADKYKELMRIVGEDPLDFTCENF